MIIQSGRYYMDGAGCLIGPMIKEKGTLREDGSRYPYFMSGYEVYYSTSGAANSLIRKNDLVREVKDDERERLPVSTAEAVTHVGAEVMPATKPALSVGVGRHYKNGNGTIVKIIRFWSGPGHANGIYRYEGLTSDDLTRFYNENGVCSMSDNNDIHDLVEEISKTKIKAIEAVMHPAHYGGGDNPYETIKVMRNRLSREEYIGALKFNVYKYNDRAGKKGATLEDHRKALFYQTELVDFLNKEADEDARAGRL